MLQFQLCCCIAQLHCNTTAIVIVTNTYLLTITSQCWNWVIGSWVTKSAILAGSGQIMGYCDWPGFSSFYTHSIVVLRERICRLGICGIQFTLYFHVVIYMCAA